MLCRAHLCQAEPLFCSRESGTRPDVVPVPPAPTTPPGLSQLINCDSRGLGMPSRMIWTRMLWTVQTGPGFLFSRLMKPPPKEPLAPRKSFGSRTCRDTADRANGWPRGSKRPDGCWWPFCCGRHRGNVGGGATGRPAARILGARRNQPRGIKGSAASGAGCRPRSARRRAPAKPFPSQPLIRELACPGAARGNLRSTEYSGAVGPSTGCAGARGGENSHANFAHCAC